MKCELCGILQQADSVNVYSGGNVKNFAKGSPEYCAVMEKTAEVTKNAREMPAFGVALDHLTQEFKTYGTAVEFCYDQPREYNGMPFECLFVRLERNYFGVNLERYTEGKYQGRAFYLNLDHNADALYDLIVSL